MDRILLLEDYDESRILLEIALQRAFGKLTVDTARTIAEAHQLIDRHTYSLAVVDLNLPDGYGIEVLGRLKLQFPDTICIVASVADDDDSLFDSLRAGAQGYLLKTESPVDLAEHLRGVLNGQLPLSPPMANRVIGYFNHLGQQHRAEASQLTEREKEVLKLIAHGASRKAIARELNISVYTANDHVKAIYKKLKVSSRVEAARFALDHGLSN